MDIELDLVRLRVRSIPEAAVFTLDALPTRDEWLKFGFDAESAAASDAQLRSILESMTDPEAAWSLIVDRVLAPEQPFALHRRLFELVYAERLETDSSGRPAMAWMPSEEVIEAANATKFATKQGLSGFDELFRWSIENRGAFWQAVAEELGIQFRRNPEAVLPADSNPADTNWFEGALLNITDSCFLAPKEKTAIVQVNESGQRRGVTYGELESLVNRVANGLGEAGFTAGDRIGVLMPMTIDCIVAYLGAIRAGCVPVSIAESFAAPEIQLRMELAGAKGIFLSDCIRRGRKELPCYQKFLDSGYSSKAIVIPGREEVVVELADDAILWSDFLSASEECESVAGSPETETNILFSSGTTGVPKAIPWTQLTPLKCAMDARFHQNVHCESVAAWPTSLGWMMGPWVVYGSLLNQATLAVFDGAPTGKPFVEFVQDVGVTMLGVIPSMVRSWRSNEVFEGIDLSKIESFSSTGECSNAEDMLYLMSRAGYKPMVEYCGGTEIGGGYIAGSVVQPCAPGCFSTPALGMNLKLIVEGAEAEQGEVFLVPPSVGLSRRLLNGDNFEKYYADTPKLDDASILRRHGDELTRLEGGYHRARGRTDDAMNLGGIKVSAVELERCFNGHAEIDECAAVAVHDSQGGPAALVVFVVPANPAVKPNVDSMRRQLQRKLSDEVNPLFRIRQVQLLESLPRTASNKIMRRKLRDSIE